MKEWAVNSGMYLAMTAFANSRHSSLWESTESRDCFRPGVATQLTDPERPLLSMAQEPPIVRIPTKSQLQVCETYHTTPDVNCVP